MSSLLNIGLSGLNASQAYLNTTSHNITNAATPGFHRQGVTQAARDPVFSGAGFFGQGTSITGVTRVYSQLLENQVLNADSRRAEYAAYNQFVSQIDNLLADPDVGLTPGLNNFFAAMQSVSANPTNLAARQSLISSGESLVARFKAIDARITEVGQGVQADITATLETINGYANAIGELNQRIGVARAISGGKDPGDLLDQRQELLAGLNQLVKTSTIEQKDGTLSVFIGSGQSLVLGTRVNQLSLGNQLDDNGRPMILMTGSGGTVTPIAEPLLNGGKLGGLLAFRREGLESTQASLGLIAVTLASAFNEQHKLGVDLGGNLGADFFRPPVVNVLPEGSVGASIDLGQLSSLTGSDYALRYDGSRYLMVDVGTGAEEVVVPDAGGAVNYRGLRLEGLGAMEAGDTAFIYPVRFAAANLAMNLSDARRVAAANPVAAALPAGNAGSMQLSDLRVLNTTAMSSSGTGQVDFASISLRYDDATKSLVAVAPAGFTLDDAAYDAAALTSGKVFTLTSGTGYSFSFKLSGRPADNDTVSFSANRDGVADNRNAALLGALQTDKLLFGAGAGGAPTATLNNAYAQLVTRVGNKTREVQSGERTQNSLLAQAKASRDSVSGVNLDEEAANLVRYQQTYQASGRVMAVAQRLFDEVLAIAR